MADTGWEGRWEPNVVGEGTLNELRDRAGQPVYHVNKDGSQGAIQNWCKVNLYSGEFRYPA